MVGWGSGAKTCAGPSRGRGSGAGDAQGAAVPAVQASLAATRASSSARYGVTVPRCHFLGVSGPHTRHDGGGPRARAPCSHWWWPRRGRRDANDHCVLRVAAASRARHGPWRHPASGRTLAAAILVWEVLLTRATLLHPRRSLALGHPSSWCDWFELPRRRAGGFRALGRSGHPLQRCSSLVRCWCLRCLRAPLSRRSRPPNSATAGARVAAVPRTRRGHCSCRSPPPSSPTGDPPRACATPPLARLCHSAR